MAPPLGKRKRGDRSHSYDAQDSSNRPSPHRPQNLHLAQQNHHGHQPRGGRRGSRGGRGSAHSPTNSIGRTVSNPAPTIASAETSRKPSPTTRSHPNSNPKTEIQPQPANGVSPADVTTSQAEPVRPPRTYHYDHITDDAVSRWEDGGVEAVVAAGASARSMTDYRAMSRIFQEIIISCVDGRLEAASLGRAVRDIVSDSKEGADQDWAAVFLDTLSTLMELETLESTVVASVKAMLLTSGISAAKMREELDAPFLTSLALVRPTFSRVSIRKTTNLLYRQSNYNLLREESEGYSKLMTEYFTTTWNEPPSGEGVAETFERVKALIGAFDLDVGRVLDVTLDVFANLLVRHYRFFIKFLRVSSWWPKEKNYGNIELVDQGFGPLPAWALPNSAGWTTTDEEQAEMTTLREARDVRFWQLVQEQGFAAWTKLGMRRAIIINSERSVTVNGQTASKEAEHDVQWIHSNGTLPPSGNSIAAQLLGFKISSYASELRDPKEVLPDNLISLTALLIKVGFISFADIYPHLYPPDEKMPELKEKLTKERMERERKNRPGGGALNALAMAEALPDDTLPAPPRGRDTARHDPKADASAKKADAAMEDADDDEKENLSEPVNQKVQLLNSLLSIGAISESLFVLGRYPWLPDFYPELIEGIHRLLRHSLSKVYEEMCPLPQHDSLCSQRRLVVDQAGASKGALKQIDPDPLKTLRWAQADTNDGGAGIGYRFYWDDWADNVPICQTVDDVFLLCRTFLNISGLKIGSDIGLLTSLIRIGIRSLATDSSTDNHARWLDLSKRLLVPALSMTDTNAAVVQEAFDLIKGFSTRERYSIYAEWFSGQTSRCMDLKSAFDQARAETKNVLKRISKTNTKGMARNLAKVALGSPGIVFGVVLNQIESYENLIDVVVECGRFFTALGYDVLVWALLTALGTGSRNSMQGDGILTSSWLRALSLFAGRVFKRYHSSMDPTPLLQYVAFQLRSGKADELQILEQLTLIMCGVRSDLTLNENQILAMAGGDLLQTLTLERLHDKRFSNEVKSSSKRLCSSLVDNGLAAQILIAMAQERQMCIFRPSTAHAPLKVLASNLDRVHEVFFQFLEMILTNIPVADWGRVIPSLVELMSKFGIQAPIAFAICRRRIVYEMAQADEAEKREKLEQQNLAAAETPKADVEMADAPATNESTSHKGDTDTPANISVSAGKRVVDSVAKESSPASEVSGANAAAPVDVIAEEPWHPVLKDLMVKLKPLLPEDFEDNMSITFYTTFWQLSLSDLLVPGSAYDEEQKRTKEKIFAVNADRSDLSSGAGSRKQQRKMELNDLASRLNSEMKSQIHSYSKVRNRLQKEKDHWFSDLPVSKSVHVHCALLQECFFPRILLSASDALFVHKMIFYMHSSGTLGFRTMHLIDSLINEKRLTQLITLCTVREAENFGRFLNELLKELRRWHSDRATYEKLAHGAKKDLPGFARRLKADKKPEIFLDFEEFRRLMFKWHRTINIALKSCMTSGDYMRIRNAIMILKAIHQQFPVVNFMGGTQLACITDLSQKESRQDLKLMALSLMADLKRQEKRWVLPQAFYISDAAHQAPKDVSRSNSARPGTPQPPTKDSSLNATAAEFQPRIIGAAGGKTASRSAVEDGEVEDRNAAAAAASNGAPSGDVRSKPNSDAPGQADEKETSEQSQQSDAPSHRPIIDDPSSSRHASSGGEAPAPPAERTQSETTKSGPPARPTHALPNRPDNPQSSRGRVGDRPNERPNDPHTARRDLRRPESQELSRPDRNAIPPRGHPGERNEPFPAGPQPHNGRMPERGQYPGRDRRDPNWNSGRDPPEDFRNRPPPRDTRSHGREPESHRDRGNFEPPGRPQMPESRRSAHADGPPFEGPHGQSAPYPDRANNNARGDRMRGSLPAGERLNHQSSFDRGLSGASDRSSFGGDRDIEAADRLGSSGDDRSRRSDQSYPRESRYERGSRPQSPVRHPDRMAQNSNTRGDAPRGPRDSAEDSRPAGLMAPPGHRDRRDDQSYHAPPTGPRVGPGGRNESDTAPSNNRNRELFQSGLPPRRSQDNTPSWVNHEQAHSRPHHDPNYGRLNTSNSDAPAGPPSGPRGRNVSGRGGRQAGPPNPPPRATDAGNSAPSPATGPNSERANAAPEASGPNAQRQPSRSAGASEEPSSANNMGGVHPSRLGMVQGNTVDTSSAQSLPSGPRTRASRHASSTASSPTTRNAPTGGPGGPEKREDQRFMGLRSIIQQGSGPPPGPNDRDRDRTRSGRGQTDNYSSSREATNTHDGPSESRHTRRADPAPNEPPPERRSGREVMARREAAAAGERKSTRQRRSRSRSPAREHQSTDRRERDKDSVRDGRRDTRKRDEVSSTNSGPGGPPGPSPRRGGPPMREHDHAPPPQSSRLGPSDGRNGDNGNGARGGREHRTTRGDSERGGGGGGGDPGRGGERREGRDGGREHRDLRKRKSATDDAVGTHGGGEPHKRRRGNN